MMVVMRTDATQEEIHLAMESVRELGMKPHLVQGVERTVIGVVGDSRNVQLEQVLRQPGVDRIVPISRLLDLVPSKTEDSFLKSLMRCVKRVHICSAVAHSSRALRLIPSRGWEKKAWNC
jgi:hypothetical protein